MILEYVSGYRIVRELASGYLARVYAGADPAGHEVTIKTLAARWEGDQDKARVLAEEGQMLRGLEHRGLRRCIEVVENPPALILEYVDGASLHGHLLLLKQREVSFEPVLALGVIAQIVDTLAYLHGQGILHLDIIPNNVLISQAGQVILIDFDNASWPGRLSALERGPYKAVPHYTPPELWTREPYSDRTDSYQIGVMLYQMLAGEPPVVVGDDADVGGGEPPMIMFRSLGKSGAARKVMGIIRELTHPIPENRRTCDDALAAMLLSLRGDFQS